MKVKQKILISNINIRETTTPTHTHIHTHTHTHTHIIYESYELFNNPKTGRAPSSYKLFNSLKIGRALNKKKGRKKASKLCGRNIISIFLELGKIIAGNCSILGCLRRLVGFNFLVNSFEIQILQIYSWTVFHQVSSQEFKTFELPAE